MDDIWTFIAEDDLSAASRWVQPIEQRRIALVENPMLDRSRLELGPKLRSFPTGNYVIFYLPIQAGIEITRVMSGFREVDALF